MTRAVRLALAMLALKAGPLAAQQQADPVHLDDYAVAAQAPATLEVDQLSVGGSQVAGSPAPHDRSVGTGQGDSPQATAQVQLSSRGQNPQPAQLSKPGAPPDESSAAVSSTRQSQPQGVVRIAGQDRCDPQLAKAELDKCRRILELRAQEFSAPAPPQLSAEQRLLAEQRYDDASTADRSTAARLRLASREDPDANLQSNQELAALYLHNPAPPAAPPAEQPAAPADDASLAQILNTLQVAASGGQGSP